MGCHSLFQRVFPTQGSDLGLLHCRQILYCLSHQGSPGVTDKTFTQHTCFQTHSKCVIVGMISYVRRSVLFFKDFFFLMWTILKVLLNLLHYCFCFMFFGHEACRILAPPPGIEPACPCTERWSLNHWTTREGPGSQLFMLSSLSMNWSHRRNGSVTRGQGRVMLTSSL